MVLLEFSRHLMLLSSNTRLGLDLVDSALQCCMSSRSMACDHRSTYNEEKQRKKNS